MLFLALASLALVYPVRTGYFSTSQGLLPGLPSRVQDAFKNAPAGRAARPAVEIGKSDNNAESLVWKASRLSEAQQAELLEEEKQAYQKATPALRPPPPPAPTGGRTLAEATPAPRPPPPAAPSGGGTLAEAFYAAARGKAGEALRRWRQRYGEVNVGPGCTRCCHDGARWGEPCFDVDACAARATPGGRYAFVYAHVGRPGWPWLTFLHSIKTQALALEADTGGSCDVVVLMPQKDIDQLGTRQWDLLNRYQVRVVPVPWTLPPKLKWWPSHWWPGKADGWCGPQDLMRLHVLGMDEYDAVVFYDQDVEFQGDATAVLKCAKTGKFLSASGGVEEPMNVGFFALRPDKRLLLAAELFAENVTFSERTGWDNSGFKPAGGYFVGAECGQGYMNSLLYQKSSKQGRRAMRLAGLLDDQGRLDGDLEFVVVDRCIWNYQTGHQCPKPFNCERIRVHHKPTGVPNGNDCPKLAKASFKSPFQSAFDEPPALPPAKWEKLNCLSRFVTIGTNCKCNLPDSHYKTVTTKGTVVACESSTKNPSGDSFAISFSGSSVTATRTDARSCWCEGFDVQCCVQPEGAAPPAPPPPAALPAAVPPAAAKPAPPAAAKAALPAAVLPAAAKAEAAGRQPAKAAPAWAHQPAEIQAQINEWYVEKPRPKTCDKCCHNGERWGVPCFDDKLEDCAAKAKLGGRYALVYGQVEAPNWPWLTFLPSLKQQAKLLEKRSQGKVDIVVIMLAKDIAKLSQRHKEYLTTHDVQVREVPWSLPPDLRWWPDNWWPGKSDGWCGPQDLVRMQVFGLDDYDAAAFYDQDIEFHGDISPVLLCASTGVFLSTSGGVGEPLNVGFFALRPDKKLVHAAEIMAIGIKFNKQTGWGKAGFAPSSGYFVGAECGQGYVNTLIYQAKAEVAVAALTAAGAVIPSAVQLDRCIWNYQTGAGCPGRFDCSLIQVHHKPTGKPLGYDCPKLALRTTPAALLEGLPQAASREDSPYFQLRCEMQTVMLGKSCRCSEGVAASQKTVSVPGFAIACQPMVKNNAGDEFSIKLAQDEGDTKATKVTVTRWDADSCWCEDVQAKCCIVPPAEL